MARYITQNVKAKIDKCAYAMALMEIGQYEWPDGRARYARTKDGIKVFRVVEGEAQRHGWGIEKERSCSRATTHDLFNEKGKYHEILMKRLAVHRQRMEDGYGRELSLLTDDGDALTHLSKKLYDSLVDDLQDPERAAKIPFKDRANLYDKVTKLEAHLKGDVNTRTPQPVIQATNVIGTLNLPDSVRGRVMKQMEELEGELESEDGT